MKRILLIIIILLFTAPAWPQPIEKPVDKEPVVDKLEWKNHKITVVRRADKQKTSWTETLDRTVDGKKETRRRFDTYTYYESGEINVIVMRWYENEKLAKIIRVKYFKDGRQPKVMSTKDEIPN